MINDGSGSLDGDEMGPFEAVWTNLEPVLGAFPAPFSRGSLVPNTEDGVPLGVPPLQDPFTSLDPFTAFVDPFNFPGEGVPLLPNFPLLTFPDVAEELPNLAFPEDTEDALLPNFPLLVNLATSMLVLTAELITLELGRTW